MTEYQEIIEGKEMMQQSSSEGTFIKDSRITALIKHKSLAALFLFLFSFAVFIPSLKGEFVWDDVEYIQKYPHDLKASEIPNKFFPEINKVKGVFYVRPILFTSFVIDREIWGVSSFGFHLSNVIFHSASTVLFYFFVVLALGEFKVNRKESIEVISKLMKEPKTLGSSSI